MVNPTEKNYGDTLNPTMIGMIDQGPHRILDVGCAQGFQLEHLKSIGKAAFTVGIERVMTAAEVARRRADRILCGDVESLDPSEYRATFDYILYGDILEHLVHPWAVVERHIPLLAAGGRMVICLPNVRNFLLILQLIRGDWRYTRFGLLDDTHLRFFTRRTIDLALERLGLEIEKEASVQYDESFYRTTMEADILDDGSLELFRSIRQKHLAGLDCSRELSKVFGEIHFSPQDVDDLITVQHVFMVRPGTSYSHQGERTPTREDG